MNLVLNNYGVGSVRYVTHRDVIFAFYVYKKSGLSAAFFILLYVIY